MGIKIDNEGDIFANRISDKGFLTRMCKEHSKLNSKKENNPVRKWANDTKRHFTKDRRMANTHLQRQPIPLAIKEKQIKAPTRYGHLLARMLIQNLKIAAIQTLARTQGDGPFTRC